jgi:hypothetical protein
VSVSIKIYRTRVTIINVSEADKKRLKRLDSQSILFSTIAMFLCAPALVWGVPALFVIFLRESVGVSPTAGNFQWVSMIALIIALCGCALTAFIMTKVWDFFRQKEYAILRENGWNGMKPYRIPGVDT